MTQEEFKTMKFRAGMTFSYRSEPYKLASVNFPEMLIGLCKDENDDEEDITWVRCENCQMLTF